MQRGQGGIRVDFTSLQHSIHVKSADHEDVLLLLNKAREFSAFLHMIRHIQTDSDRKRGAYPKEQSNLGAEAVLDLPPEVLQRTVGLATESPTSARYLSDLYIEPHSVM